MSTPFTLFGANDVLDLLTPYVEKAVARTRELRIDGFDTDSLYDIGYLRRAQAGSTNFCLVSRTTGTEYGFAVRSEAAIGDSVQVFLTHIGNSPLQPEQMIEMTIRRGTHNQMTVVPGWARA
ncbi:hypothetical protein JNJ66_01960 [Candidatus Saccharibacteria bacterium]|nr:hypothetical protein [Candidatus Saccharibacteria bacterium]